MLTNHGMRMPESGMAGSTSHTAEKVNSSSLRADARKTGDNGSFVREGEDKERSTGGNIMPVMRFDRVGVRGADKHRGIARMTVLVAIRPVGSSAMGTYGD